jgi:PAS domain-containing protein
MRFPSRGWLDKLLRRSVRYDKATADFGGHKLSRYLQAFLENTSDQVLFLDRDWRITFLNQSAARELPGGAALMGRNIWEAFPPIRGTAIEERYRRAVADNAPQVFEAYYPPLSAWYEVHAVPVEGGLTVFFHNSTNALPLPKPCEPANASLRPSSDRRWSASCTGT